VEHVVERAGHLLGAVTAARRRHRVLIDGGGKTISNHVTSARNSWPCAPRVCWGRTTFFFMVGKSLVKS
jgi:hypothetical protein